MTIAAKYEDGVFKPLEDVTLTEGARVEVHVRDAAERPRPFATARIDSHRSDRFRACDSATAAAKQLCNHDSQASASVLWNAGKAGSNLR